MKTFREEYPEVVANTQKVLRKFKNGKVDMQYVETYFYSTIGVEARRRAEEADHEAAYKVAQQILDTSINLYANLGEYNLAQEFQQFLFTKLRSGDGADGGGND
jgi:hypothetical protein